MYHMYLLQLLLSFMQWAFFATDKVIAIAMIVVSVVVVFPVAGPVALATYIFLKKKGSKAKSS